MLELDVEGRVYAAQGVRDADIKDPEALIQKVKQISTASLVLVDADFIAGRRHLVLLLKQVNEALRRGATYAKQLEIDFLARVACETQLKRAVKEVGLKLRKMNIVALSLYEGSLPVELIHMLESLGTLDDSVIELTNSKFSALAAYHNLTRIFNCTLIDNDILAYLIAERSALLACEHHL
jgi:tRNA threonylcarbamoyladenosine modification (KEOPS) complex Cgi121 subunit